jgi:hypothetical protein
MNRPTFEAPGQRHGAAQHKPHKPKAWARRDQQLPGKSMRAEHREQDKVAATAAERVAAQMARVREMEAKEARAKADKNRKVMGLVDGQLPSGVWELQSWMDGGKTCPDSQPEWKAY